MAAALNRFNLDEPKIADVVIKIGSNQLTTKEGYLDRTRIEEFTRDIMRVREQIGLRIVLVTSGAVAAGRARYNVKKTPGETTAQKQLYAGAGQTKLMEAYRSALEPNGWIDVQALLDDDNLRSRDGRKNLHTLIACGLAQERLTLPICNANDSVSTDELLTGDNDVLAGHLAELVGATRLLILSTSGILRNVSDKSTLVTQVPFGARGWKKYLVSERSELGTGGMASKCQVAQRLAREGIETCIADGRQPEVIRRVLMENAEIGTRFLGRQAQTL